ncbi:MAG: hypothetical protein ACC658_11395 [Acidimicrobiia bacterium]
MSARIRDAEADVVGIPGVAAVVGGDRGAQALLWGLSIAGLPWHLGGHRMRRIVLCPGPVRSRLRVDALFEPRTANRINETAFHGEISTEANGRFVLHDRGIDTPTLSPESSQPSHQSLKNPPIRIVDDVSGSLADELTAPDFFGDERRVGGFLTLW